MPCFSTKARGFIPAMRTLPSVGSRYPSRSEINVLFPAPLGPASPNTSLSPMVSEKLSTARIVRPSSERYVWPTPANSISAV